MPLIVNLETAGLLRLDFISGKPPNKSTVLSCKTIMKCFCVYGIALSSLWQPRESSMQSQAQIVANASVNTFHSADKNFDNTLNALYPMELLVEK